MAEASKDHLFKPGNNTSAGRGNIAALLREQSRSNAEIAVRLRRKFLDTLESRIATIEYVAEREAAGDEHERQLLVTSRVMALLGSDVNKLITDSENRGLGAPKQIVEVKDGALKLDDMPDWALERIAAGEDPQAVLAAIEDAKS